MSLSGHRNQVIETVIGSYLDRCPVRVRSGGSVVDCCAAYGSAEEGKMPGAYQWSIAGPV